MALGTRRWKRPPSATVHPAAFEPSAFVTRSRRDAVQRLQELPAVLCLHGRTAGEQTSHWIDGPWLLPHTLGVDELRELAGRGLQLTDALPLDEAGGVRRKALRSRDLPPKPVS